MSIILERSRKFDNKAEELRFFEAIHELDIAVYNAHDAGTTDNMINRFQANQDTFIVARDTATDKYVGYINYFPCSPALKNTILNPNTYYDYLDDVISSDQIVEFTPGMNHFIYILSVVVHPDYRYDKNNPSKPNLIRLISEEFVKGLRAYEESDIHIEALAGCIITPGGEKFARSLRFRFDHYVMANDDELAINTAAGNYIHRIMVCDNATDIINRAAKHIDPDASDDNTDIYHIATDKYGEAIPDCDIGSVHLDNEYENTDDGGCLHQLLEQGIYVKTWKDDIYLCIPLTEHETNKATADFYSDNSFYDLLDGDIREPQDNDYDWIDYSLYHNGNIQIPKRILAKLKECIEYECENNVARDLKLLYLGCYDFLHTTDQYPSAQDYDPIFAPKDMSDDQIRQNMFSFSEGEVEIGLSKGYVFLTLHPLTHMYILCVFFPNYKYSSTQLLDQLSNNYIKIVDPRIDPKVYLKARRRRYIRLYDFLWENFKLHKCGQEKAFLCMSNKPDSTLYSTEFQNILNAEVYNSTKVDYHIDNESSKESCETNRAQYDYYEAYTSNRVVAYIPKEYGDINDRIDSVATISFIVELIMFQNTAMARMNKKVTQALTTENELSMDQVLELDQEYGRTIPFWEPNNFKYLGAQAEANVVKEAFSNEQLKETYNEYQEFLEHLVDLKASERENRNSMILNIVATILAIIQIEGFIEQALIAFYDSVGISVLKDYADFSKSFNNSLLGTLIILFIIIFIRHRKAQRKIKERLRK